jgi:guanine deaminase
MDHKQPMQLAIDSARMGIETREGGPFGACVVRNNEVVSVGHNTVLKDKDPTCHAEMNAIRAACKKLDTHILSECVLYTTAEPCPMCLAAIYWSRVKSIVVGVPKEVAARYGFDDAKFYSELLLDVEKREVPATTGVLSSECEKVFADWKGMEGTLY